MNQIRNAIADIVTLTLIHKQMALESNRDVCTHRNKYYTKYSYYICILYMSVYTHWMVRIEVLCVQKLPQSIGLKFRLYCFYGKYVSNDMENNLYGTYNTSSDSVAIMLKIEH